MCHTCEFKQRFPWFITAHQLGGRDCNECPAALAASVCRAGQRTGLESRRRATSNSSKKETPARRHQRLIRFPANIIDARNLFTA